MFELPPSPFDDLIGAEWGELGAERATATLAVAERHKQPVGLVHGGVYCALAESLASLATASEVVPEGNLPLGMSNNASFLRPISEGTIHVEAKRLHRGRASWVWDVECRDDEGRLCVTNRVTIAVRPMPGTSWPP